MYNKTTFGHLLIGLNLEMLAKVDDNKGGLVLLALE